MTLRTGYRIGITIFVTGAGELALFENGLRQNVLFLYRLFAASPSCAEVFLLNHGDAEPRESAAHLGIPQDRIRRSQDVPGRLDFVIVAGAAVDASTVERWKSQGTKVIAYKGGNGAVISMEAMCGQPFRKDAERYFDAGYYDAIWMTPQHIHTYKGWCETIYRCPVHEIQQVWEPLFIDAQPEAVRARFGYKPGKRPWRVGIMDPNITVMKTSHLPMMACEAAWRAAPERFLAFYVTNGLPHADNLHFRSFAAALGAAKTGVMTLEPRFVGPAFVADHADAVVTHHWENGLNYLYYEVLFGDYPLVHNSTFIRGHGYWYADFDADGGGAALVEAHAAHDDNLEVHRTRNAALFAQLAPTGPVAIHAHEALLSTHG